MNQSKHSPWHFVCFAKWTILILLFLPILANAGDYTSYGAAEFEFNVCEYFELGDAEEKEQSSQFEYEESNSYVQSLRSCISHAGNVNSVNLEITLLPDLYPATPFLPPELMQQQSRLTVFSENEIMNAILAVF